MQNKVKKTKSPSSDIKSGLSFIVKSKTDAKQDSGSKLLKSGNKHYKSPFNDDYITGNNRIDSNFLPTIRNSYFSPRSTISNFKPSKDFNFSTEQKNDIEAKQNNKIFEKRLEDLILKFQHVDFPLANFKNLTYFQTRLRSKIQELFEISLPEKQNILELINESEVQVTKTFEYYSEKIEKYYMDTTFLQEKITKLEEMNKNLYIQNETKLESKPVVEIKDSFSSNELFIQYNKLKLENKLYEDKVNSLIENQNTAYLVTEIENLKQSSKKAIELLELEIKRKQRSMETFELKYLGIKGVNEKLEQINLKEQLEIMRLQDKIQNFQNEISSIVEEKNMYRERFLMQFEDFRHSQMNLQEYKYNFIKLREMLKLEKAKFEKILEDRQKLDQAQGLEHVIGDFAIINYLRDVFTEKDLTNGKQIQVQKSVIEFNDVKINSIARPSFKSFTMKKIKSSNEEPVFKVDFIAMIRAIFDSKFHELQYCTEFNHFSRFPEFVFSWTGKFIFCSKLRNTRLSDIRDPEPDILRSNIVKLLNNKKSYKLWECIVFKEFLDEYHYRDELAYFLMCRNLLFNGPMLNNPSASFNYIYYVKLEWAEMVMEHLLREKYTKDVLNMIRSKLRNKMIAKNRVELIDSSFFLRILVEEYKREKTEKMNILKKAIEAEPKIHVANSRYSISFESFKNVITNYFPESLEIEKSELYRKTWIYGNGFIDAESILLTLNEENFFLKTVNFKDFKKSPLLDEKYEYQNIPENEIYKFFAEKFSKLVSGFDAIKSSIFRLGVEKMMTDYFEHEKVIRSNFQAQTTDFRINNMVIWINTFFMRVFRINDIYLCSQAKSDETKYLNFTKSIWNLFEKILVDIINQQNDEVLKDFETNHKTRRLQKFFKSKLSTWYKLMNFIIKNKITKYYNQNKKS